MKDAQDSVATFGRSVNSAMKGAKGAIAGAVAGFGAASLVGSGVQDAMRYEALMATLGETLGSSRKDFEKWMATSGNAMGYSRLQAADLASTLSINFKKIAVDQKDLVNKTTKMMEMAAVVANKRGMTMEDVSDRIRSAMNQEADAADELGVNVRAAVIEQSAAYKELAGGQPFDKLSEAMRKTILYEHILQQVTENLGATLQDTTALRMAQFKASLTDVRMALGQAFLPILYNVLPVLNRMAQALYQVLQVVSAFMRALFGGFKFQSAANKATTAAVGATKAQTKAVGGLGKAQEKTGKATKKAAKEAKRGVASFDEVNTLTDPADAAGAGDGAGAGAGGGGGGVGDLAGLEPPPMDTTAFEESISDLVLKFEKFLAPIKEKARIIWTAISDFAKEKFDQIKAWWDENGPAITEAFNRVWNIFKAIVIPIVKFIWESIKGFIDGVIQFFEGLILFFTGIFTGDWKMIWEGLKDMFIGAFKAIWNFTNLTFIGGMKKGLLTLFKDGIGFVKKFADDIIKWFKNIWKNIGDILKNIGTNFKSMIDDLKNWWTDFFMKIALRWELFVLNVKLAAFQAVKNLKDAFNKVVDWFARTIITPIVNKFEEIKNAFKEGIGSGLRAVFNTIAGPVNEMINSLNNIKNNLPLIRGLPNIPKLPRLAKGGIATAATLAVVGEGRQDEAIAPLDKLQGFISNAVREAGGGGNTGDIILNIDGRSFARIVKPFLDNEQARVGSDVRIRTI